MKKALLFLSLTLVFAGVKAQMVDIAIEEFIVHPDTPYADGTDLSGYTTYRVYAVTQNDDDFMSAVYGVNDIITQINSTTDFWQSPFGGPTADNVNPAFFPSFPSLEYDSFVTIGKTNSEDPGPQIFTAEDPDLPWIDPFEAGEPIMMFGGIGGSWFTVNFGPGPDESPNGYPIDNQVLIAQLTTTGELFGCINAQVFINGDGGNQSEAEICIGGDFGCLDSTACNFNSTADQDDGSCLYPCMLAIESVEVTNPTCAGDSDGQIIVNISGGQSPVTYQLNSNSPQAVGVFNNVWNNSWDILISDAAGICEDDGVCAVETTIVLNTPAIDMDMSIVQPVLCNDDCNGILGGTFTGNQGSVEFDLSPDFLDPSPTPDFADLCSGTYTVYAMDSLGCTNESDEVVFSNPFDLTVQVSAQSAATCSDTEDGQVVLFSTGGTGDVDYSTNNVDYQESNILMIGGGDYTIYAMDENGCVDSTTTTVGAPDELVLTVVVEDVLCFGDANGTITSSATGGNGGNGFSLDGGDPDNMGDYIDLETGDYTVYVEDDEGCSAEQTVTVGSPEELVVSADVTDISCFGEGDGSITVIVTGGTEDYMYSNDGIIFGGENTYEGLDEGDYDFWVQDANGCAATTDGSITEPDELVVTIDSVVDETNGDGQGSIDITITGGTGAYTITWFAVGFDSNDEDISGLSTGEYEVTVVDENGCEVVVDAIIVDNIIGIEELANAVSFTVSPNPSNGQFIMNIDGLNGEKISYVITDLRGRTVASEQLNTLNGQFVENINISDVENGMYLLTLYVDGASKTVRVIKQN